MKPLLVYLDFDGTVVQHRFPAIGEYNHGCQEVLYKLQDAGHQIIINSVRCDLMDDTLREALEFMTTLQTKEPILNHTQEKLEPDHWNLDEPTCLFIDDIAIGIPVKIASGRLYVDWILVDNQLETGGFYKKTSN